MSFCFIRVFLFVLLCANNISVVCCLFDAVLYLMFLLHLFVCVDVFCFLFFYYACATLAPEFDVRCGMIYYVSVGRDCLAVFHARWFFGVYDTSIHTLTQKHIHTYTQFLFLLFVAKNGRSQFTNIECNHGHTALATVYFSTVATIGSWLLTLDGVYKLILGVYFCFFFLLFISQQLFNSFRRLAHQYALHKLVHMDFLILLGLFYGMETKGKVSLLQ